MFKTTPFEEIKEGRIYYNQLDSRWYQIHYIKKFFSDHGFQSYYFFYKPGEYITIMPNKLIVKKTWEGYREQYNKEPNSYEAIAYIEIYQKKLEKLMKDLLQDLFSNPNFKIEITK